MEALYIPDTNLITAETTLKFFLDYIYKSKSYNHTQKLEAIYQQIVQERYTDVSVMLQYLHIPSARLESKSKVKTFCAYLVSRIMAREDTNIPTSEDVIIDSNVSQVSYSPEPEDILLAKKLQLAIDASMQILQDDQPQENSSLLAI